MTSVLFSSYLLSVDFIHTNTILYTKFYTNFVTKESWQPQLAWQGNVTAFNRKISFLYLIRISIFFKNAVRNFNFILGYTIFTLILIICKSFKKKYWLNFTFYSFIFSALIILKPVLEPINSETHSQLRKCFTKDFFWQKF